MINLYSYPVKILLYIFLSILIFSCGDKGKEEKKNESKVDSKNNQGIRSEDEVKLLRFQIDSMNARNEFIHQEIDKLYNLGVRGELDRIGMSEQYYHSPTNELKKLIELNRKYADQYDSLQSILYLGIDEAIAMTKKLDSIELRLRQVALEEALEEEINKIKNEMQ